MMSSNSYITSGQVKLLSLKRVSGIVLKQERSYNEYGKCSYRIINVNRNSFFGFFILYTI